MKKIVALVFTGVFLFAGAAQAAPSKGKLVTLCKMQAKAEMGENARVKVKRIRGSKVQLRVAPEGGEATIVVCTPGEADDVELAYRDGSPFRYLSQVN